MKSLIRLAGRNISIDSLNSEVHELCDDYRVEGSIDFYVKTTKEDIDFERAQSIREAEQEGYSPYPYSDSYLETLAVYRKIAERMPNYDTFLFHGSCVAVDGVSYLFTAKSGTGKSTHTRLWRKLLGGCAVMVNDDKPLIRLTGHTADAYGTPWDGKHHLSRNISVPLKAICILERGVQNSIKEITRKQALPMLIQQTYRPYDPIALQKTLTLLDRMDVRLYRLSCNMDISAAELSYNTMKGCAKG